METTTTTTKLANAAKAIKKIAKKHPGWIEKIGYGSGIVIWSDGTAEPATLTTSGNGVFIPDYICRQGIRKVVKYIEWCIEQY